MPYTEESPFAAAVGAAAGYLKGKADAKARAIELERAQNEDKYRDEQMQLDRQRIANETRNVESEISDRAYQQAQTTRKDKMASGVDPDTGKSIMSEMPSSLTQVSPANKGKGPTPGSVEDYRLQWIHAQAVADWLGGKGYDGLAADFRAKATQAEALYRTMYQQQEDDKRQAKALQNKIEIHIMPTYRESNPGAGGGRGRGGSTKISDSDQDNADSFEAQVVEFPDPMAAARRAAGHQQTEAGKQAILKAGAAEARRRAERKYDQANPTTPAAPWNQ